MYFAKLPNSSNSRIDSWYHPNRRPGGFTTCTITVTVNATFVATIITVWNRTEQRPQPAFQKFLMRRQHSDFQHFGRRFGLVFVFEWSPTVLQLCSLSSTVIIRDGLTPSFRMKLGRNSRTGRMESKQFSKVHIDQASELTQTMRRASTPYFKYCKSETDRSNTRFGTYESEVDFLHRVSVCGVPSLDPGSILNEGVLEKETLLFGPRDLSAIVWLYSDAQTAWRMTHFFHARSECFWNFHFHNLVRRIRKLQFT